MCDSRQRAGECSPMMLCMSNNWTVADMPPQIGKRFLITGANSGIGYIAAVELARRGAVVVLACRDEARGAEALKRLRVDAAGPDSAADEAELAVLDLASLESVRVVAKAEVARSLPLHGLINNAGVMAPAKRRETKDGFELQFGTNLLGHFALTCGLMDILEMGRSASPEDAPRVVTLSSLAHKRGSIHFDDLQSERSYAPMTAYAQSKIADLMFAFELQRRCKAGLLGAISLAAHPGVAETALFKVGSGKGLARLAELAVKWTIGLGLNSTRGGALPVLYAATAVEAKGGEYYGPQGFREMRGEDVGPAEVATAARDVEAGKRLWQVCEELTGTSLTVHA